MSLMITGSQISLISGVTFESAIIRLILPPAPFSRSGGGFSAGPARLRRGRELHDACGP